MTKVSIIIPVFNAQNYLKECMDSVINQSFNDFEVICVNDGSTDESLNIIESYQKRDSRIKIIDQENRGLGASRNVALEIVKGEYVLFLDSDDYLDLDSLNYLYNLSVNKNLDMLIFKITNFNHKTRKMSNTPYFEMDFLKNRVQDNIFSWEDIKDCIFDVSVTSASKLFKRDLICDIKFPEGLIFEDNLFFIKTVFKAQRIYFSDRHLYFRRIRTDSITNSYHERFSDCIDIYDLIVEFFNEIGKYEEFGAQIFDRQCFDCIHRFKQLKDEYKNEFYLKFKNQFLNQKDTLDGMNILEDCSERSLEIYNSTINSNNYRELELLIKLFDLQIQNKKYKKDISRLNREIEEIKNTRSWKLTGPLRDLKNKFY